jgi:hypothetical protein
VLLLESLLVLLLLEPLLVLLLLYLPPLVLLHQLRRQLMQYLHYKQLKRKQRLGR